MYSTNLLVTSTALFFALTICTGFSLHDEDSKLPVKFHDSHLLNDRKHDDDRLNELNGLWSFRCNGTAVGYMDLNGNSGTIRCGGSRVDKIDVVHRERLGKRGSYKLVFNRTGQYSQQFVGWVSTNHQHISGFVISGNESFPWSAIK